MLVLPSNYAFGLRRPDDKIWGYWGPDDRSFQVWNITQNLVSKHGLGIDIVYEDNLSPNFNGYSQVCYWNQTLTDSLKCAHFVTWLLDYAIYKDTSSKSGVNIELLDSSRY